MDSNMAYASNYYNTNPMEEIVRNQALQNYAQTRNLSGYNDLNQNQGMMPLPPQYAQENNYIARKAPQMGPPSQEDLIAMFSDMKNNPGNYNQQEIDFAKNLYSQMFGGELFDANVGRALGNAAWEFADTIAFGLLPDQIAENMGVRNLHWSDTAAGTLGSLGAFFTPMGPVATGSKVASKALPMLGRFAKAEGKAIKLPEILQKALGKTEVNIGMKELLNSDKVAARLGSAIGGGFNFETGVNPLGLAIGAMFPMGVGKGGASVANDQQTLANIVKESANLDDFMMKAVSSPGGFSYTIKDVAKKFGVAEDEVMRAYNKTVDVIKQMRTEASNLANYNKMASEGRILPQVVTPRTYGRNDADYLRQLNSQIDEGNRVAENLYKRRNVSANADEIANNITPQMAQRIANMDEALIAQIATDISRIKSIPVNQVTLIDILKYITNAR